MRATKIGLLLLGMLGASGCAGQRTPASSAPEARVARKNGATPADAVEGVEQHARESWRLHSVGELAAAEGEMQSALAGARSIASTHPLLLARVLTALANQRMRAGRYAEARQFAEEAKPLLKPGALTEDRALFALHMSVAESHRYERHNEAALQPFRLATEALAAHEAEAPLELFEALTRLATAQTGLGQHGDACQTLQALLELTRRSRQLANRQSGAALQLAVAYGQARQLEAALALAKSYAAFVRKRSRYATTAADASLEQALSPREPRALPTTSASASFTEDPARPASAELGDVQDAAAQVAAMRQGFQACYDSALRAGERFEASVRVVLDVAVDGTVSEARAISFAAPVGMADCVLERALAGQFSPPSGGKRAVIAVPVSFIHK